MSIVTQPAISVIIPCYNQGQYLNQALDSLAKQTFSYWECIIVNDGSTDNTQKIIDDWCKTDNRYRCFTTENNGLSAARNLGLRHAKGSWIQFLDADDFLESEKLYVSIDAWKNENDLNIIFTDFKCFNEDKKTYSSAFCDIKRTISLESILLNWDNQFVIPIHCALFNKALLSGFNEGLRAKEDWVMWIDLFSKSIHYKMLEKPLAIYRIHNSSMTKDQLHMEKNTLSAYEHIYLSLNDSHLKTNFFKRVMKDIGTIIQTKDEKILFLRNSYTYKIGDIILKPLKLIRNFLRSN